MSRLLSVTAPKRGGGWRFVDGGRPGLRHLAIPGGGPADRESAATGNLLLKQAALSPCIEITLSGGRWRFNGQGTLALTGADFGWQLDGHPVDRYTTLPLEGEHELRGGFARRGCRGYLCVRGDWQLPRVMGSIEAGLPGAVMPQPGFSFRVSSDDHQPRQQEAPPVSFGMEMVAVDVVAGPEWHWLDRRHRDMLLNTPFRVGPASDRQGVRLELPASYDTTLPSLLSSPVLPGTVQWTPSGPILLGPDAQTVGGYPRVLVATALPDAVFQLRPGGEIIFRMVKGDP
ncbi:5-oxoprolinase subunit C family protein [Neolewinella litorea]|uniref:Biotin-dependent carboxyltransferase n=1 Tax=Neolewinella litorea TaxID=2562452 RepID=A0A4S4NS34_9BACT|nr:biotin-dependent carboxyltransferase family protein [Neolewinella litorea]THH42027.1 biotin-dependent carboxyltransferase [Neolewinella litorea]